MKNVLKILAVGGVVYLAYRYLYPYLQQRRQVQEEFPDDGRTTFYSEDGTSYIRGFVLPENIDDFETNEPILITKPDEFIFGEKPKSAIEVKLDREKNKIQHISTQDPKKIFVADYDEVKDKLVMLNDDIKKQ